MAELFYRIGDILDYINNYIQFFIIIFTLLATLFLFMLPYIRPLDVLLGSIGLSKRDILRVLWLCYTNPRKRIRLFIEMAIVKSNGKHRNKKWWRTLRRDFKKFLDDHEEQAGYTITVETPFELTATEFNELTRKYFGYFKRNKTSDRFGIPLHEPVSFISSIEINEGYIAPIAFIMGLNDRYDEDWVKILRNYFTAFSDDQKPEHAILPQELYFTYNWLMWGPSYQLKYDKLKDKLIQYGYGDESNSVNVVLKNNGKGMEMWEKLNAETQALSKEMNFGFNCSLKGKIFDTSEYYNFRAEKLDSRALPFLKRLASDYLGISFLLELDDYEIKTNYKAENYFFSAYLWIMFGLNDENTPGFTPRKSLTFFEHANLADTENYNFLAQTLIEKCFSHFDTIASDPKYKNRKYHYCLSMNSFIENLFKKKLTAHYKSENGDWYQNNILLSAPYTISEILDTFDNYFISKEDEYELIEVNPDDKESIKLLCNYYAETYLEEFSHKKNALTLDKMLALLQEKHSDFSFHIGMTVSKEGEPLGCCKVFYFPALQSGYIDSIAVHKNHRNYGIGKSLLQFATDLLRKDTHSTPNASLDHIIAAIPSMCFDNKHCKKYRFWYNNGFIPTTHTDIDSGDIWSVLLINENINREAVDYSIVEKLSEKVYTIKK